MATWTFPASPCILDNLVSDGGLNIKNGLQPFKKTIKAAKTNLIIYSTPCLLFVIYSHSMVPGGFWVMSYSTRLIPATSLVIRLDMMAKISYGNLHQSAVMASTLSTQRITMVSPYDRASPMTPTLCTG